MPLAALDNQVVFKKLLQNPEILKAFIKDFLAIEIEPQSIEVEKKFSPPIANIDIIIDIFVDDPTHRLVIDIQKARYDYDFDRFFHYHQAATLELAKSYKAYKIERTVYTIVWLTRKVRAPLYQNSLITTSFCSETEKGQQLAIYPHKLFFLNPFYLNEHTPPGLVDWMTLVNESIYHPANPQLNLKRPIMQQVVQLIDEEELTPQERFQIMDEREYEQRRETDIEAALHKKSIETAQKMLAKGYNLTEIMELTNLAAEELTTLVKK
jgi:predicted transposase/invertase (TIGR01784 family)